MATAQSERPTNHASRDRCHLLIANPSDEELIVRFLDGDGDLRKRLSGRSSFATARWSWVFVVMHFITNTMPRMLSRRLS